MRNLVKLHFQNRHGLLFIKQWKRFQQFVAGITLAGTVANDLECLIKVIEDNGESLQQVDSLFKLPQIEFKPPAQSRQTEFQEFLQDLHQAQASGDHRTGVIGNQAGGVVAEILLK